MSATIKTEASGRLASEMVQVEGLHAQHTTECAHPSDVLVKLDCRAGGFQYRIYCADCWADLRGAIPHSEAQAEESRRGIVAPLAELEHLHAARDAYEKRGAP